MQGITKLITTFSAKGTPLKSMLLEFTTNLVDSSYLGCPMFFPNRVKKKLDTQKTEDLVIILTDKYTNILEDKSITFFNWLKLFGKKYRCEICWGI